MKATQLLNNALAILATTKEQSPEYADFAVPLINLLLMQTFECNNSIRSAKGLQELDEVYEIESLEDELPCENELAREALPLGLCARFVMDEDDMAKVAYYQNEYVAAVQDAGRWTCTKIKDVYGGTE